MAAETRLRWQGLGLGWGHYRVDGCLPIVAVDFCAFWYPVVDAFFS